MDRPNRNVGGRPSRGGSWEPLGAKLPSSLVDLVTAPVGTAQFPTLTSRVIKLMTDGLDSYEKGPRRLGVIYAGTRKQFGVVDIPQQLMAQIVAMVNDGTFSTKSACYLEMLHRGLAMERGADVTVRPEQLELPLAPTGT